MQRRHIDLIDIRPLFAIDFDIDEQLVHHARGRFILEAFVRHDMAPMAGGVADREENGSIAALGLRQRFGSPWPPIDRVVLVLQQIRTGLGGQAITATVSGGGRGAFRLR